MTVGRLVEVKESDNGAILASELWFGRPREANHYSTLREMIMIYMKCSHTITQSLQHILNTVLYFTSGYSTVKNVVLHTF